MDGDEEHHLLRVKGLLDQAQATIDLLLEAAAIHDEERRILAASAMQVAQHGARTRADVLRFTEAVSQGNDGWLVLRSVPGEHRTDGIYLTKLPRSVRQHLDL